VIRTVPRLLAAVVLTACLVSVASPAGADTTIAATIVNYKYQPNPMTVQVGDIVIWTNQDQAPHDVTSTSGPSKLNSGQLNQGDQWGYNFTQPGTYSYYCTLHPDMHATLTVTAASSAGTATTSTTTQGVASRRSSTTSSTSASAAHVAVGTTTTTSPGTSSTTTAPPDAATGTSAATADTSVATTDTSVAPAAQLATPAASRSSQPRINPLLFLAAVTAGVIVFTVLLMSASRDPSADRRQ